MTFSLTPQCAAPQDELTKVCQTIEPGGCKSMQSAAAAVVEKRTQMTYIVASYVFWEYTEAASISEHQIQAALFVLVSIWLVFKICKFEIVTSFSQR